LVWGACAALTGGCATLRTLGDFRPGDPVFLSGSRFDVALIRNDPVALKQFHSQPPAWPWFDLPFSFGADLFFWIIPRTPTPPDSSGGG
jgi:uncharacterized protein YceK